MQHRFIFGKTRKVLPEKEITYLRLVYFPLLNIDCAALKIMHSPSAELLLQISIACYLIFAAVACMKSINPTE
jgi:hypothetical protein